MSHIVQTLPETVYKTMRNEPLAAMPTLFGEVRIKQLEATHSPDEKTRAFDVKPLFFIIKDIIMLPTNDQQSQSHIDKLKKLEDNALGLDIKLLADPIKQTSSEIISQCGSGVVGVRNGHLITMAVLQSLSRYSWEAKATIVLAAFAVSCGEFLLVGDQRNTANPVALLKVLAGKMEEQTENDQKQMLTLRQLIYYLIVASLDLIECTIKLNESTTSYKSRAKITAVYWVIRIILVSASLLLCKIKPLHGHHDSYVASAAETRELSFLVRKLYEVKQMLTAQVVYLTDYAGVTKSTLALVLPDRPTYYYGKARNIEGRLPLFDGTHMRKCSIDVLRKKHVLLLLSDLQISHEQLSILHQIYIESRQQATRPESQYEVVWLPVVHEGVWTDEDQKKFELLQNSMPWYSVADPMMRNSVIKLIKEEWAFDKKPQLVVLDPQGHKTNDNAFPMIWIWGSLAFPFSKSKEEALWRDETWRIDFLADSIHPNLFLWVNENRYICLYGGEDIEWIRQFTTTARTVANAAGIPLEMLYVGKSNPKERVRRNNSIIQVENLSHVLPDLTLVWFFWVRLESMWHSKVQHGMTVENDPIMQEIVSMLSFDGSDQGWAVFSRGSHEMAKGKAETVLQCLSQYDRWKDNVVYPDGFVITLNEQLHELHTPHHCNRLILPGTGQIPELVVCPDCGLPMEKYIMYRCCPE